MRRATPSSRSSPAGSVTGLAGVILWTGRFDAQKRFYVDVLGLIPRSERPGFVNFAFGDVRLTVATHDGVDGPARDPLRVMVNLSVDDIDATYGRLVTAGVDFIRPPEVEPWGGRIATFTDPDGNTLQLMELPGC